MNSTQKDNIDNLKNFLRRYHKNNSISQEDPVAKEANISWAASHLFAKLIHNAEPQKYFLNINDVLLFKNEYELTNSVSIDLQNLINKHWLRVVLGFVNISNVIRSAASEFDKIKNYKHELLFLTELKNSVKGKDKSIDKAKFKSSLEAYQSKYSTNLDTKIFENNHWIELEEDKIEIKNIHHYEPILENWDEIAFINALKIEKYNKETGELLINEENLKKLHFSHQQLFTETPALDTLISQQVLRQTNDTYYFCFYQTKVDYWATLKDEISGYLWMLLLYDSSTTTDKDRLLIWFKKVINEFYWPEPLNFVTGDAKKRFLDAALDLVTNDPDINSINQEYPKLLLDDHHSGLSGWFYSSKAQKEDDLDASDYFELYESLEYWEDKHQGDLLVVQNARVNLSFLIKTIVISDNEYENEINKNGDVNRTLYYRRIKNLILSGLTKPFLLWETSYFILQNKPEILPYLLVEKELASLTIKLIDKVAFSDEFLKNQYSLKLHVWSDGLKLALDNLLLHNIEDEEKARFIFQIFRQLNQNKYKTRTNLPIQLQNDNKLSEKEKESKILSLIEEYPQFGSMVHQHNPDFFFPKIMPYLFNYFKTLRPKQKFLNGTIEFPMLQMDSYVWLLRCFTYNKYHNQLQSIKLVANDIAGEFLKRYIEKIEQDKVIKFNYDNHSTEEGLPTWSEKFERLDLIEWLYPVYFLHISGHFESFLSPNFKLKKTTNIFDEENRFTVEKIRTHIAVLLQISQAIAKLKLDLYLEKTTLQKIKVKIETQIGDYLEDYCKNVPSQGLIDIFDSKFERIFLSSEKEELIPRLGQAINWFSQKEKIIKILSSTNDLLRLLTIADWITSEGGKRLLIDQLNKSKIEEFLKEQYWPEVQIAMLKLAEYSELIEQTERILDFWEKNFFKSKKDKIFKQAAYQVKLLLAYHKKDEIELNKVFEPEVTPNVVTLNEFNNSDLKQFYRGLIRLEFEPKEAYLIFDQLLKKFNQKSVIALNKFASKIKWATNEKSDRLFIEALEEWQQSEGIVKDKNQFNLIQEKIWANKLFVYHSLQKYEDLDKLYLNLDEPYRMQIDILSIKIESLLERKLDQQARGLFKEARIYHQFSDGKEPEFINNLKLKIDGTNYISTLKNNYLEIYSNEPSTLIQVFPQNLNGKIKLIEFLTKEIAVAVDKMLDKIRSIEEISLEDKYNDLVQLALESRIIPWGWHVKDQTRGAFSNKNLGERDIVLYSNQTTLLVCEAFIYRAKASTQTHLRKIFNYHHNRSNFIILIYYKGKQALFEKTWKDYCDDVITNVQYPIGFSIKVKKLKDVTNDFGYKTSAIKIGRALHNKESVLYHVFVNINYKLS